MTTDWRAIVLREIPSLSGEPEILEELSQHLADVYDRALADGLTPEAARAFATDALPAERDRLTRDLARARTALPGLIANRWTTAALDATEPAAGRASLLRDFGRDLIYALRALRGAPGYTIISLLTLAIGIGANAALFAAVDTILLRPMPYAHANRLVVPMSVHAGRDIDTTSVSFADYVDWQKETGVFDAVAIWRPINVDLTGAGEPQRIRAMQVAPEYFTVLTMTPVLGRTLVPADHDAQAPRVTVLSHAIWQRTFGGASDVLGRSIGIGGVPHEVVGVLPARVAWPENAALFVALRPALADADTRTRRDNLIFSSIARLGDTVPIDRANAVVAGIAARLERDHPDARKGWTNRVAPLREFMVESNVRRALWVMLAAVGAVLLIGCANLAHLGLLRGLGRARELGVRVALGASRWRIVRQLAVESVLLAAAGAIAGAGLAIWMIEGLAAIAPAGTPFIDDLGLDVRVLGATALLASIAVIVSGLVPAIAISRVQPEPALRSESTAAGSSRRVRRLRQALIVVEVAGAVVLLVGAALLLRSFARLQHVDPGVDVDRVLAARIALPRADRYATGAQTVSFFERLEDRLRTMPGVEAVGSTSFVPIGGGGIGLGRVFLLEGWPEPPAGPDVSAQWNTVTPGYFRAAGIPLVQGRAFTAEDRETSTPVMIVSRSFATQMFGTANPLGKRVRSWRDENLLREIVGVVGEVRYTGLGEREVVRQMYVPHTQQSWGLMNIVVRSAGGAPSSLEPLMRAEVRALDSTLAVSDVATFQALARDSIASERYTTLLLSALAATALALGAIGIYGVISHAVSMRRRELGLRAALGASPSHLRGLVIKEGVRLTVVGLVLGLAVAFAAARVLEQLLYQTESRDPLAYVATAAMIAAVAALACAGPARRAARVDPIKTLRMP